MYFCTNVCYMMNKPKIKKIIIYQQFSSLTSQRCHYQTISYDDASCQFRNDQRCQTPS